MSRLSFEELGLLRLLERAHRGGEGMGPAVRHALVERGLVEPGGPVRLTPAGEQALSDLRRRPIWQTGEIPALRSTTE